MREVFRLIGKIALDGTVELNQELKAIDKRARTVGASMNKMGKDLTKIGMEFTKGVTVPIAAAAVALYKGTELASDLNETISKTNVIFGSSASQIEDWANGAAKSMGQTKTQAMEAADTFAIFGKSAGLAGTDLVDFSKQFVGLASDLASFNNTSPEEAITAIGAAFRGETEPIRRYGVLLDDASLRQKALELGIISSIKNALTPQQRVLAASSLIMEQTTAAQGDFARTSDQLANQQRIFKAEIMDTATQMGTAFLPVAKTVVGVLRDTFLPVLKSLAEWFNNLSPGMRDTAIILAAMAAAFGPVLVLAGKLSSTIGVLIPLVAKMITGQLSLNAAMAANPVLAVVSALAALVAVGVAVYENWDDIKAAFTGVNNVSDQQISSVKKQRESLEDLTAEYQRLKSKTSLTADEKKRFYDISNKIAEIAPNVVTGYDKEGNALIDLNSALKVQVELKRQELALRQTQITKEIQDTEKLMAVSKKNLENEEAMMKYRLSRSNDATITKDPESFKKKVLADYNAELRKNTAETETNQQKLAQLRQEYEFNNNLLQGKVIQTTKVVTDGDNKQVESKKTLTDEEKKLIEKRNEFNSEWTQKYHEALSTQTKDLQTQCDEKIVALEAEKNEELAKATKLGADKNNVIKTYALKEEQIRKETAEAIKAQEDQVHQDLLNADLNFYESVINNEKSSYSERLAAIESAKNIQLQLAQEQYDKDIAQADANGQSKAAITAQYSQQLVQINENAAQQSQKAWQDSYNSWSSMTGNIIGTLQSIYDNYYQARINEIDSTYQREKEAIENSTLSEEEKQARLDALEADTKKKKSEQAKKQAKKDKEFAIFEAIINTAQAIVNALTLPWPLNLVMAALYGAMGATEIQAIKSEPVPELAEGGKAVKPTFAMIGEGEDEEAVLPLNKKVFSEVGKGIAENSPGGNSQSGGNASTQIIERHYHIGFLIADDPSLKKFVRAIKDVELSEDDRRGLAPA
jgi:hypothetical protein